MRHDPKAKHYVAKLREIASVSPIPLSHELADAAAYLESVLNADRSGGVRFQCSDATIVYQFDASELKATIAKLEATTARFDRLVEAIDARNVGCPSVELTPEQVIKAGDMIAEFLRETRLLPDPRLDIFEAMASRALYAAQAVANRLADPVKDRPPSAFADAGETERLFLRSEVDRLSRAKVAADAEIKRLLAVVCDLDASLVKVNATASLAEGQLTLERIEVRRLNGVIGMLKEGIASHQRKIDSDAKLIDNLGERLNAAVKSVVFASPHGSKADSPAPDPVLTPEMIRETGARMSELVETQRYYIGPVGCDPVPRSMQLSGMIRLLAGCLALRISPSPSDPGQEPGPGAKRSAERSEVPPSGRA